MIQRIQSIYLAIVSALLLFLIFASPDLAVIEALNGTYTLTAVEMVVSNGDLSGNSNVYPLSFLILMSLGFCVYAIFQYKKRKLQMSLVRGVMVGQLLIGVLVFFYADRMATSVDSEDITYGVSLIVLLINVILCILAYRGIKKDDELVRSADRLR